MFSERQERRIVEGIKRVEGLAGDRAPTPAVQPGALKAWVRITSTSTTSITLADASSVNAYPGKWVMPGAHATDGGDVWVMDANAVALTTGKYYEARLREYAGSPSYPVYETDRDPVAIVYAPVDAQYIVAASNATLTAERVATDTLTVTWDFGTAGQAKANVPAASASAAGHVTTGTQTLAGAKTFTDDVRLDFQVSSGALGAGGKFSQVLRFIASDTNSDEQLALSYIRTDAWYRCYFYLGRTLGTQWGEGHVAGIHSEPGDHPDMCFFIADTNGSIKKGVTGSAFGISVQGGIIYSLPSALSSGSVPISNGTTLVEDAGLTFDATTDALQTGFLRVTKMTAPPSPPTNSRTSWFSTDPGP